MSNKSNQFKGIVFLVIAALGFAFMSLFIKLVKLSGDPIPTGQMVLFRNLVSVVVAIILIRVKKSSYFGKKENINWLLFRSALGTAGMLLFFYSLSNLNLSDANMLNKLSTFFLIIFSALFLKEKVKPYQIIAIIVAFIGSLFIIKPVFNIEILPYVTSVLAAMFAGAAYTVLRVLGKKEEYYTIVLFFSTFSVVVLLPYVLIFSNAPMTVLQTVYLILAGASATVGQFGTTLAYKYAPAREISIFNYTNVVFAALLGIMFLGEIPDPISLIGYLVIFGAAFYIFKKK